MDLDTLVRRHGPVPLGAPSTSSARCARRSPRRTPADSCTATSSRQRPRGPAGPAGPLRQGARLRPRDRPWPPTADRARATHDGPDRARPRTWRPRWPPVPPSIHGADIYAVGCVAYYLITGRRGVRGPDRRPGDRATPARRARRAVAGLDTPLPPALDALVLACLEKSPADRPRDILAVAIPGRCRQSTSSRGPTTMRRHGGT